MFNVLLCGPVNGNVLPLHLDTEFDDAGVEPQGQMVPTLVWLGVMVGSGLHDPSHSLGVHCTLTPPRPRTGPFRLGT